MASRGRRICASMRSRRAAPADRRSEVLDDIAPSIGSCALENRLAVARHARYRAPSVQLILPGVQAKPARRQGDSRVLCVPTGNGLIFEHPRAISAPAGRARCATAYSCAPSAMPTSAIRSSNASSRHRRAGSGTGLIRLAAGGDRQWARRRLIEARATTRIRNRRFARTLGADLAIPNRRTGNSRCRRALRYCVKRHHGDRLAFADYVSPATAHTEADPRRLPERSYRNRAVTLDHVPEVMVEKFLLQYASVQPAASPDGRGWQVMLGARTHRRRQRRAAYCQNGMPRPLHRPPSLSPSDSCY